MFLCSAGRTVSLPRPDCPAVSRAAAVKHGRRPPAEPARSVFDGSEHDARLRLVGMNSHAGSVCPTCLPPVLAPVPRPCSVSSACSHQMAIPGARSLPGSLPLTEAAASLRSMRSFAVGSEMPAARLPQRRGRLGFASCLQSRDNVAWSETCLAERPAPRRAWRVADRRGQAAAARGGRSGARRIRLVLLTRASTSSGSGGQWRRVLPDHERRCQAAMGPDEGGAGG
jgi:hypothetical protein